MEEAQLTIFFWTKLSLAQAINDEDRLNKEKHLKIVKVY